MFIAEIQPFQRKQHSDSLPDEGPHSHLWRNFNARFLVGEATSIADLCGKGERWTAWRRSTTLCVASRAAKIRTHAAHKQSVRAFSSIISHPSIQMYGYGIHHRINRMAARVGGRDRTRRQGSHRSSKTSSSPATISTNSAPTVSKTATRSGVSLEVRRHLACRRAWRALDFDDLEEVSDPGNDGFSWSLDRYDEEEFWSQIRHRK